MSSLNSSLDATNQAISTLHGRIACTDPSSVLYRQLFKNMCSLLPRKDLLAGYSEEMSARIEKINAEADKRIQEIVRAINDERGELIANVKHEFEDKLAELPALALDAVELAVEVVPKSKTPINDKTTELVTRYIKKYADEFKAIPIKMNFFHAAACSGWCKYVSTENEDKIRLFTHSLLSKANLPSDTHFPLSLSDVDRILHLPSYDKYSFIILDTSPRVILTNIKYHEAKTTVMLLIYNSQSNIFAPVSIKNIDGEYICLKCFRYPSGAHVCQRQCLICLRVGDKIKCSKPFPESTAHFCFVCQAYCQTPECFVAHKKICPHPVSGLRDDILQIIESLDV